MERQAKEYLSAIYSYQFGLYVDGCQYHVSQLGKSGWEVVVYPRGGGKSIYYMELRSDGSLVSLLDTASYSNEEATVNVTSVLPRNLKEVLCIYGQRMVNTIFQGTEIDTCLINGDDDYSTGRVLHGTFVNSQDERVQISYSIQIAPELRLLSILDTRTGLKESVPIT